MSKREGINMNDYLETKELYHHGIKGQKWGVIRKEYHQSRQEHAAKQEAGGIGTAAGAILGGTAGLGLSFLLNKSKVFRKTNGVFREVGTGETYKHSVASVAKRVTGMAFAGAMLGRKIGKAHAMKKSQQERVEDAKFDNLTAAQKKALLGAQQIQHSGIKGQRWGVRRFQNEDGTLTEAGKARYNQDGSRKNPEKMSDTELANANRRLSAESQYRQLTGTTQPGRSINRDTAIKIGATFVSTAAATFLLRKYKKGTWLGGDRIKDGTFGRGEAGALRRKKAIGSAFSTAALAGGIGALMAGASSLGGSARPESGRDN